MPVSLDTLLGFIFVLLVLAPGLIGLDLYHRVARRKSSLSRIKWVAYSTAISIVSLTLVFLAVPVSELLSLPVVRSFERVVGLRGVSYFATKSLAELLFLYFQHVLVVGLLAVGVAVLDRRWREEELDRREAWKFAFDEGRDETDRVEVVMTDGAIIRGDFIRKAWDRSRRELYLDDPVEVEYVEDPDGGLAEEVQDIGRSTFLNGNSISRILFLQEDPQSGRMDAVDEAREFSDTFLDIIERLPEGEQTTLSELKEEMED